MCNDQGEGGHHARLSTSDSRLLLRSWPTTAAYPSPMRLRSSGMTFGTVRHTTPPLSKGTHSSSARLSCCCKRAARSARRLLRTTWEVLGYGEAARWVYQ